MTFQVKYKNIAFHLTHSQVQFLISAREITVFYLLVVLRFGVRAASTSVRAFSWPGIFLLAVGGGPEIIALHV